MGVSARIAVAFLFISLTTAIPAGKSKPILNNGSESEKKRCCNSSRCKTYRPNSLCRVTDCYDTQKLKQNENKDLMAESSEVISEAVAAPAGHHPTSVLPDHTDHSLELVTDSQNFFPSFANLFDQRASNFRFNQEGAYSQRPNSYRSLLNYPLFGGFRNIDGFTKQNSPSSAAPLVDASSSVLGSGNFGIIRGGTFFAQSDDDSSEYGDDYNSFYNNGHGRPLGLGYIANPRPDFNRDQFANFRDFADINTPTNSAYSHYVVVYANKNSTLDEVSEETRKVLSEPKNIIETLELLDSKPQPKISKTKSKLALTKEKILKKKDQWKKNNSKHSNQKHDADEPLLALS